MQRSVFAIGFSFFVGMLVQSCDLGDKNGCNNANDCTGSAICCAHQCTDLEVCPPDGQTDANTGGTEATTDSSAPNLGGTCGEGPIDGGVDAEVDTGIDTGIDGCPTIIDIPTTDNSNCTGGDWAFLANGDRKWACGVDNSEGFLSGVFSWGAVGGADEYIAARRTNFELNDCPSLDITLNHRYFIGTNGTLRMYLHQAGGASTLVFQRYGSDDQDDFSFDETWTLNGLADGQYGLELRSGANSAGCCLTRNATWYVNQINIIATP
ncbi:MAG: hypothetical protein HRU17_19615 [Polyangiaceae bacterium]|nr:hypothetical protein [Polyangiaceae bacterium]